MENILEWLKRILRSAFEDSVRSIISTVIIAVLSYGATQLWQKLFSAPPNPDGKESTSHIEHPVPPTGPTNGGDKISRDMPPIIEPPVPPKPQTIEINLNEEIAGPVYKGKDTYHIPIPASGCVSLQWQAGERESSKVLYTAGLYRVSVTGDLVMKYDMTSAQSYKTSEPVFVSSGDYYISVMPEAKNAVPYRMTVQFEETEHIELEGNDAFSNATPMEEDTTYHGSLQSKEDEDYYCFKLTEPSAVNVTIGAAGDGVNAAVYTLTIHDTNRNKLTETTANGKATLSEMGNLYLRAGTYYVTVKKGNTWTGGAYAITVNTSKRGVMEAERNDTPDTANAIPVNEDVHASIGREDDVDCFNFTLKERAAVTPYFDFKPLASDLKIYSLTIAGGQGGGTAAFEFRGNGQLSKAVKPVQLEAGTYSVRVSRIRRPELPFALHEYVLRIDAQSIK